MSTQEAVLQFAMAHPYITGIIAFCSIDLLAMPFKVCNRVIRHLNIRKAGWPPPHVDADGDQVEDAL